MYPRKGVIAVGSDADIVIWDPTKKKILNDKDQLSKAGYSTYAGKEVTGLPIMVIRRGEIVVENGKVIGQPGSGKYIPGDRFPRPANNLVSND
jgi:dihydropyrimidinase